MLDVRVCMYFSIMTPDNSNNDIAKKLKTFLYLSADTYVINTAWNILRLLLLRGKDLKKKLNRSGH